MKSWRVEAKDSFAGEWYSVSGHEPSRDAALEKARALALQCRNTQDAAIRDRVYIVSPEDVWEEVDAEG